MTTEEAHQLLGSTSEDSGRTVKIKYRRLIRKYHPDAVNSDSPEHTEMAQRLNHAYQMIKTQIVNSQGSQIKHGHSEFKPRTEQNEDVVCERNLYMSYHYDETFLDEEDTRTAREMYQTVGRGKYYWDPDEEDFSLFLKSVRHAMMEYLKERSVKEINLNNQAAIFWDLCSQFVRPLKCLRALEDPEYLDSEGREVYHFRAFLGAKQGSVEYRHICDLTSGAYVYPNRISDNRLMVSDGKRNPLGYISLDDDALYLCVIPLLKSRKVQVKIIVETVGKQKRGLPVRANLDFYLKILSEI